ncbi:ankyrin repeat domain-containing protein [Seohaeicola saemankumensis]|uniref:ankyrin repeat domain-containing protein n=1 Tax=Seohaeicola saemankumensis TaxID=481181 RepID=UPI001E64957A|nr:ankyrin repeat domain-containing protein [Seohaeicola saemankumensis]MCD1628098.1 ankyrin repeat domain-containing protein [Seohaeicola saemankumensis]
MASPQRKPERPALQTDDGTKKEPPDIFRAAREDDLNELERALADGQSLDAAALDTHLTPVHVAAMRGSINFLEAAMMYNPQTAWMQDGQQRTPFDHAAARQDRQSMAHLHNAMYPEMQVLIPDQ